MTVLVWFRRDLRLGDNPALLAALARHEEVVPVFVRDPSLLQGAYAASRRNARLDQALAALDLALRGAGGRLVVREGRAADELARIAAETGATEVFGQREYTPYGRRREREVAHKLSLHLEPGLLATEPEMLGDQRVFAAFHRRWAALPAAAPLPAPRRVPVPRDVASLPLPEVRPRGEADALARVAEFARTAAAAYADRRDRLDLDGTSHLSADLHFGTISVRQVLSIVDAAAFRRQLAWRDWANHLLWWRPETRTEAWRERYRAVTWRTDGDEFAAWRRGETGFPTVDAAMRQLAAEGWISNRARLIVASFLTKELLLDWREGERHFLRNLEDGDVANNWLGWQWVAGIGTDAAPYFRILDPSRQGERFDPDGEWVRRWVPELRHLPARLVHRPWDAPAPPAGYPAPIVERRFARERAQAAFRAVAQRETTRET